MYPSSFNVVNGVFVHEQVKALIKKGVEVKVVSPVPCSPFPLNLINPKWRTYSLIEEEDMWEGVLVYHPRYIAFPRALFFASSGMRMYWGIKKFIGKIYEDFKFNLIHAHTAVPDGFCALKLKEIFHVPVVVTVHGQDLQVTIHKNSRCKDSVKWVFENADRIITVSTKLKRLAYLEFGFSEKITVINNGISTEKIKEVSSLPTVEKKDITILVSVSNLYKSKGIDLNLLALSELLKRNRKLKYIVIGDGPERKKLEKLAKSLRLEKHVEFLGKLPHKKALEYIAKADIFSLPSWREGFGVVYLEAMALGKPVIACRGEGIEDVIEDKVNGILVEPRNVGSLIEALDFLLTHPNESRVMGKRDSNSALKKFTWGRNAEKTIDIYKEVFSVS
jgi:glycosyltransferase involved in cell wall biosynthesis